MAATVHVPAVAQAAPVSSDSSLADAIRAGDRNTALRMIVNGVDVNAPQGDGTTPLHWAVYKLDVELTKALLAHGAQANVVNQYGSAPLAEAVKGGNLELVKLLLEAGVDVEAPNADGQTALMLAARNGEVGIAEQLVRRGANVNATEQWRGQTALMWAAAEKHPDMVSYLVKHGAKVNVRSIVNDWGTQITSEPRAQYRPTGGLTPLLYAARSGCVRCAEAMLKAGADINLPTPEGVTPLMTAIDNLNYDIAKFLLERGANPHVWDWWGRTALYVAVDMHRFTTRAGPPPVRSDKTTAIDILELLLAHGVNPNPQLHMLRPGRGGNSGRFTDDLLTTGATPLLRAAIAFDNEAITLLLKHGALVDLPNAMGVTPFMAASGMGVSIRDPRGNYTVPDIQSKAIATMDLLLKAGADVNARATDTASRTARIARPSTMTNRQGQTALYAAINWSWTQVVQYLLDHGARVDIKDAAGKTPLDATRGNAGGRDFKASEEITAMIQKAQPDGA
jgi:ankyrin repeat protein